MIEPHAAAVRPRIYADDDLGSTELLEERIAARLEDKAWGKIALVGAAGAGKTKAIAHLANRFDGDPRLVLRDGSNRAEVGSSPSSMPEQLLLFTSPKIVKLPGIPSWRLAPWTQDEWIEYLLAAHPAQCASAMRRVQADDDRSTLPGAAGLWKRLLDHLATNESTTTLKEALRKELAGLLDSPVVHCAARRTCFWLLFEDFRKLEDEQLKLSKQFGVSDALCRLLAYPIVRELLAAEYIADQLIHERNDRSLSRRFSPTLMHEVSILLREEPEVFNWMKRLLNIADVDDQVSHATAASLLHACGVAWCPRLNTLPKLDFAQLRRINWSGARISHLRIEQADLSEADLKEAQLDRTEAKKAKLFGIQLHGAQLQRFSATFADLSQADLSFARASHADFKQATLANANLEGALLCAARFVGADLKNARFCRADLSGANFSSATIEDADFTGANLTSATMSGLKLRTARFDGAQFCSAALEMCDLEQMQLPGANFEGAKLTGAYLTGSQMPRARFRGANLKSTGLAEIQWEGADLRDVDLRGSTFHMGSSRSGLIDSPIACEGSRTGFYTDEQYEQDFKAPEEIRKANLCNANLHGARIDGVDFYLVDLCGAEYSPEQEEHFRKCGAILESRVS
jgi:uncharacterized protein YjbI with pentapeptide repeats